MTGAGAGAGAVWVWLWASPNSRTCLPPFTIKTTLTYSINHIISLALAVAIVDVDVVIKQENKQLNALASGLCRTAPDDIPKRQLNSY